MAISTKKKQKSKFSFKSKEIIIKDPSICYQCKTTGLSKDDIFCPNCGFPQQGTSKEQNMFLWRVARKKQLVKDKQMLIKKARNILFILSGFTFVIGFVIGGKTHDISLILVSFVIAAVYFSFGLWSNKKPFTAIASGFLFYIITIVINTIVDPATIFQGLLWKVIFISGFVYGISGAMEAEKLEKELKGLSRSHDFSPSEKK